MKLTKIGLMALRGSKDLREKIAELEGTTVKTVNRWVRENSGSLTKAAVLEAIKAETQLTDQLLLERVAEAQPS